MQETLQRFEESAASFERVKLSSSEKVRRMKWAEVILIYIYHLIQISILLQCALKKIVLLIFDTIYQCNTIHLKQ